MTEYIGDRLMALAIQFRDLVVHCAKEMAHLASFLSAHYRDRH